ncbi:hypothetical protein MICA_2038 [Micavibrio aeruginosavorus ARL-13]|uniref:Uncharacterized protein n=1 Tax=Micavibrio aeruginosavorus (strain ARL-13) TaxID=856793 RepID=G2KPX8_MICAA|nr:hypothetical protein MICA_2038 [Micavibrio aeruginosavorus ARL-13]
MTARARYASKIPVSKPPAYPAVYGPNGMIVHGFYDAGFIPRFWVFEHIEDGRKRRKLIGLAP